MSISTKYSRTYHYPFSLGTTSDDRFNYQYWQDLQKINSVVHTEKLDGENNCLSKYGVFARSHVTPTTSAWTAQLRQQWSSLKNDLGDLEIFGENLYAIHSIEYQKLESYFYIFAVRLHGVWLSWEETKFYANCFDFPTVPEIKILDKPQDEEAYAQDILEIVEQPSIFESYDIHTQKPCSMEGIVTRNTGEYEVSDFEHNVFKYVRKNHVKTDEHWTRNWKRASLVWEK